jgi:AmmeMemoRadiSam system protein B
MKHTLGPNLAGTWYPADAEVLRADIRRMLDAVEPPNPTAAPVQALIEPHAGYMYSGQVAAAGFSLLQGRRFERVILIGPSHHEAFQGVAVPSATDYSTPLGSIPLDQPGIRSLDGKPGFLSTNGPFQKEHCLEIELPFLQETLEPGWHLLPLLVGYDFGHGTEDMAASAIRRLTGPDTLLVASSDFTHYGHNFGYVPFEENVPERLRKLDLGAVDKIVSGDRGGFRGYVQKTGATICGRHAIDLLMNLLPESSRCHLVSYNTSGQITGDWSHSVSYATLAFHEGKPDG